MLPLHHTSITNPFPSTTLPNFYRLPPMPLLRRKNSSSNHSNSSKSPISFQFSTTHFPKFKSHKRNLSINSSSFLLLQRLLILLVLLSLSLFLALYLTNFVGFSIFLVGFSFFFCGFFLVDEFWCKVINFVNRENCQRLVHYLGGFGKWQNHIGHQRIKFKQDGSWLLFLLLLWEQLVLVWLSIFLAVIFTMLLPVSAVFLFRFISVFCLVMEELWVVILTNSSKVKHCLSGHI